MPDSACSPSPYFTIKFAGALYDKTPEALDGEERKRVDAASIRALELEQRILSSREAVGVMVGEEAVDRGVEEISSRFTTDADFVCELARHGLSHQTLRAEIERSLRVDTVLERVASRVQSVSHTEVEIFYHVHRARFTQPERRSMRHILITVNEEAAGSSRAEALAKLEVILDQCRKQPARFAELALRHSECPTAMQGGLLGRVERGKLYPELEAVAFGMRPGEISSIQESPMGFHILRCDNIEPGGLVPLSRVRDKIREQLLETRKQNKQRAWIKALPARRENHAKAA